MQLPASQGWHTLNGGKSMCAQKISLAEPAAAASKLWHCLNLMNNSSTPHTETHLLRRCGVGHNHVILQAALAVGGQVVLSGKDLCVCTGVGEGGV